MDNNTPDPTPDDPARAAEADTQQQPIAPIPAAPPAPFAPPVAPKIRWRDRVFRFRSIVAVAVASVILGLSAGVLGSLAFDHDQDRTTRDGRFERQGGPGGPAGPGGPGRGGFPDNAPQQGTDPLPPGSLPQQEEDATPQDDTTSSS